MKRVALAALALTASACSPNPPASAGSTPSGSTIATADTVVLNGERAFAVAELAHVTAAKGIGIAADAGLITGAAATSVREKNAQARVLLVTGKATTDAAVRARAAARLLDIAGVLDAIVGGK